MPSDADNNIIDYKNDDSIYDNIDDEHDDYYDMTVGESRTVTNSNDDISPGFTLLPISIPGDYQDQPDLEHESSPSIDYDSEYHETEPVQQVPNVYSNQETTQISTRRRPSILMTPPLRSRTVSASRPTTTVLPSTTTTIRTTTTATTTTATSTTLRTTSSSTSTTTTTFTSKSSSVRSSEESIVTVTDVPGGIMVFARKTTPQNVRRRITPKYPKIMHPKFVFTTETTTLKTSTEEIMTTSSILDDDSTTEMSSSTTTTTTSTTTTTRTSSTKLTTTVTEDKDNPIYFHHFDLTEDEQTATVDSDLDIVNEMGEKVPDKNKTLYRVEPYYSTTIIPTFEDLEVINVNVVVVVEVDDDVVLIYCCHVCP